MVKFAFASIFLTLASIFALVSAVPAASSYSIASIQTAKPVFSDGTEREGDRVITVAYSEANSGNSVLTIEPTLEAGATFSTVQGKAGLYISAVDYPANSSLFWRKVPYKWIFSWQVRGDYVISVTGNQDGYWSNDPKSSTGQLALQPGTDLVTQNEMSFIVNRQ